MSFATDASILYGATSVVTVTPSTTPLLTISQLRNQVNQSLPDDDQILQGLCEAAVGVVENLIGRPLLVSTMRASYPAVSTTIRLPHPLTSNSTATLVTVDDLGQATVVDNVSILERDPVGILFLGNPLTSLLSPLRVHITYDSGYANPYVVPAPLIHAVKILVSHWYQHRSATSGQAQHNIPWGVEVLCKPYSLRGLVS